jgi:hypothetical protein
MYKLKIATIDKKGWCDRDVVMYHACFQILVDFVEQEKGLEHCNYEAHKDSVDVLKGLYDWWKAVDHNTLDLYSPIAKKNINKLMKHRGFLWT